MKLREKQGTQGGTAARSRRSLTLPRHQDRTDVEKLMRLAIHLSGPEHDLLMAVYNDGIPLRRLCRLLGVRSQTTLARRVQRALGRLASPGFRTVLSKPNRWPAERQAVAEQVWLRGCTNGQAAAALGLSLHRVRQHVAAIKTVLGVSD